VLLLPFKI